MTNLTYKQAIKISRESWIYAIKHGYKPEGKKLYKIVNAIAPKFDKIYHKEKYVSLLYGEGLCEYIRPDINGCQKCILYIDMHIDGYPCKKEIYNDVEILEAIEDAEIYKHKGNKGFRVQDRAGEDETE